MMSFLVTWFSNLHILRNLSKTISLQSFNAVGSSFIEGLQKRNDDVIITSFHILEFEISILQNWLQAINLPGFSYPNQILQRLV